MTNSQAKSELMQIYMSLSEEKKKALDMAFKAMEQADGEYDGVYISYDLISRQAVMDCYKKWQPYMATRLWDFEQELSALPSINPQTCKDAISRQALLKLMGEEPFNWTDSDEELQEVEDYRNFRNMVEQLPSVKPPEPTGYWIDTDEGFSPCECSECKSVEFKRSKYCPNCGAKMVEEQERSE